MTDKSDERKALESLVANADKPGSIGWTYALQKARSVLTTAPAEPPKGTHVVPCGCLLDGQTFIGECAHHKALRARLSAPPSGEVAALIERLRATRRGSLCQEAAFMLERFARLSEPVPDKEK